MAYFDMRRGTFFGLIEFWKFARAILIFSIRSLIVNGCFQNWNKARSFSNPPHYAVIYCPFYHHAPLRYFSAYIFFRYIHVRYSYCPYFHLCKYGGQIIKKDLRLSMFYFKQHYRSRMNFRAAFHTRQPKHCLCIAPSKNTGIIFTELLFEREGGVVSYKSPPICPS